MGALKKGTGSLIRKYAHYSSIFVVCACFLNCAGPNIYHDFKEQLDEEITFSQVLNDPESHKGKMIYWGGTIINTLNMEIGTQIEVLQKPLDSRKIPQKTDQSEGRFLVRYPQYLDPAIYAPKRDIVVVGKISGSSKKPLGEIEYNYPLISAKEVELIKEAPAKTQPSIGFGLGIGL